MQKITMNITLTLKGPLLTQSSNPGELGLDLVVARKDDTFYFPATLVVGKLRQALEELKDVSQNSSKKADWFQPTLDIWLGKDSEYSSPKSKQLYFSDFELEDKNGDGSDQVEHGQVRNRIRIDEKTMAVEKGQLVMMENPFTSAASYAFTGKLYFFAPANEVDNTLKHIKTGFNWFSQVGAMKSTGFGQVEDVVFSELCKLNIPEPASTPNSCSCKERIELLIKPLHSFCLSGKPMTNNLFQSEAIISGGALIGSIAKTWSHLAGNHNEKIPNDKMRKDLRNNFSKIRITHGFPSQDGDPRPVVAPLSLVTINNTPTLYDVALLSKPCLINDAPPDFAMDWKDNQNTLKGYPWPYIRMQNWGWSPVQTELRVRTGINRETYRSKKAELFAYEQVIPKGKEWHATLDLSRIQNEKERADLLEQLKSLLKHGIISLGKTKTITEIKFKPSSKFGPDAFFKSQTKPVLNNKWVITLQTDTLMGNPEKLNETCCELELFALYKQAWDEISNGDLELVRYFARQKLSGGAFRKIIFQKKAEDYKPWLLTEAGSVFVLQAKNNTTSAEKMIGTWLNQGLPLAKGVYTYYEIDESGDLQWQQCPFLPQNGYGEIAVNIDTKQETKVLMDEMVNSNNSEIKITPINLHSLEKDN